MTQLVVGAVGAFVGFWVGGPAGASIGWSIGVAIAAPTQRSKGPRLGELTVMSAAYGDTIPWIAGNPRIAGQIWWSSVRREVGTTTEQGKGGGAETTTYTYEIDLLIGLCDREITYVSRIWSNGKLVWTALADADDESINNSNVVTDWQRLTVYTGAEDQLPDPTYEAAVGVGNAPAYRGRGSVFIESLQLGSGGQVPNLTFEVVVDGTVTQYDKGFLCQFDEFSSGSSVVTQLGPDPLLSGSAILDSTNKKWGASSVRISYPGPSGVATTNTILNDMSGKAWRFEFWAYMTGTGMFAELRDAVTGYGVRIGRGGIVNAYNYEIQSPALAQSGGFGTVGDAPSINVWTHIAIEQKPGDQVRVYDSQTGGYVGSLGASLLHVFGNSPSMGQFQMYPDAAAGSGFNTVYVDSVLFRWFDESDEDQLYLNGYVEPDGPFEPPPYAYTLVDPDDDTIRNVVETLCRRTGIPEDKFDASALDSITKPVRALSYAQVTPIRGVLEQLASAYFFEMYVTDKLYFVPRGGSVVLTVDADDMGAGEDAHAEEPLTVNITADSEIPAQIALTYANVDSDHNKASEHSDRLLSGVVSTYAMEMPVACTSAEAKGVADAALLDTYSSRIAGSVPLPMSYTQLVPTDVVVLPGTDGTQYRARLVRRRDAGSVIDFEWVNDDPTALVSAGITSDDYTPGVTVTLASLTTTILLDIPLLRDADNSPGIYSAMKPVGATWPGAQLLSSIDGIEYEPEGTVSSRATFGTTTTALTSYAGPNMFDMVGSVTVNVGAGTMSSATRDDLLNLDANAVLIGNEIIQYLTATLQSAGIYALTGLLRGRRGTDWAMTGHAIGERAVVLNTSGMLRVSHEAARIGLEVSYKGVTLGKLLSTATAQTNTDTGVALKPFSPKNLRASRSTNGDIVLSWDRRSRLSSRFPSQAVPLGESFEDYDVDVMSGATVRRTLTSDTSSVVYSALDQANDFGSLQTSVSARVYQNSQTVGRGYPLAATVAVALLEADPGSGSVWGMRPVIEIGAEMIAASTNVALASADGGETYTVAQSGSVVPVAYTTGMRRYWDAYIGTQRICVGINIDANFSGVIVGTDDATDATTQFANDPATDTWHVDGYPRTNTSAVLAVGALYGDGTNYHVVGRLADQSQTSGNMYLYEADAALSFVLQGQLTQGVDPNELPSSGFGSFNSSWFTPNNTISSVYNNFSKLSKVGARWFLSSTLAAYYTDAADGLAGWLRCPMDLGEGENNPPTNINSFISVDGYLMASRVVNTGACLSVSSDSGETWATSRPIPQYSTPRLFKLGTSALMYYQVSGGAWKVAVASAPFTSWAISDVDGLAPSVEPSDVIETSTGLALHQDFVLLHSTDGIMFAPAEVSE